jgi:hypothetical protein
MSEAFVSFMTYLITKRFLQNVKFVMMDNTVIHSQGNATVIKDTAYSRYLSFDPQSRAESN